MGSLHAAEFAESVESGAISLEQALSWHLSGNHYPPVPHTMVPVCIRAIKKARKNWWSMKVRLPKGVTFRSRNTVPVHEVVRSFHLDCFI